MLRVWLIAIGILIAPAAAGAQPYGPPPGPPPYAPPPPPPPSIERSGFTIGVGLGLGNLELNDDGNSQGAGALFFELHLGGMLTPHAALLIELWGCDSGDEDERFVQSNVGIALQYWATRRFWLKGGFASSRLRAISFGQEIGRAEGGVIMGALGYELFHRPSHALDVQLRITGAGYEDSGQELTATTGSLQLGFSWY